MRTSWRVGSCSPLSSHHSRGAQASRRRGGWWACSGSIGNATLEGGERWVGEAVCYSEASASGRRLPHQFPAIGDFGWASGGRPTTCHRQARWHGERLGPRPLRSLRALACRAEDNQTTLSDETRGSKRQVGRRCAKNAKLGSRGSVLPRCSVVGRRALEALDCLASHLLSLAPDH